MKRMIMRGMVAVALCLAALATSDAKSESEALTGEVVDVTCFLAHNGRGEKHIKCAQKCLQGGLPPGLLVGEQLYLILGDGHESAGPKMAPYAGKRVVVRGTRIEKNGMRAIEMDSVEIAK